MAIRLFNQTIEKLPTSPDRFAHLSPPLDSRQVKGKGPPIHGRQRHEPESKATAKWAMRSPRSLGAIATKVS